MAPRSFTRVPVRIHATIRTGPGAEAEGVVRDLSLNGVCVESSDPLVAGEPCDITLLLHTGTEPIPVQASGTIVRSGDGFVAARVDAVAADDEEHFTKLVLYNAPNAAAFEDEADAHADERPALRPKGAALGH